MLSHINRAENHQKSLKLYCKTTLKLQKFVLSLLLSNLNDLLKQLKKFFFSYFERVEEIFFTVKLHKQVQNFLVKLF